MNPPPDCTLTTSCFDLTAFHAKSRPLKEAIENMRALLEVPCYLVIYTDIACFPLIQAIRQPLDHLTVYVVQPFETTPYFDLVKEVKANREKSWPTRDERTCSENHVLVNTKHQFVIRTMDKNPFQTSRFGWIDANLGKNFSKIAEDYHPEMFLDCLRQASDKFHIQVLTAIDKKFLKRENKPEYYEQYRWVVCGSFFTTGVPIGRKIAKRMDELFRETTTQGYGHGEEMLYLEILEELHDDLDITYGDYGQLLNNYAYPTRNLQFIHDYVFQRYLNYGYHREAYACSRKLVQGIETGLEFQKHPCSPQLYFSFLFGQYLSGFYADRENARGIVDHIYHMCEIDPLLMAQLNNNRGFYEEQFKFVM
jgi:hypothetical protein